MNLPYLYFTSMDKLLYPLQDVLNVKNQRVKAAEKLLKQRQDDLAVEQKKLKQREEERDKVLNHRNAKLKQLRDKLDEGTTAPEIEQMKLYLNVVKENLEKEEAKVKKQKEDTENAQKKVQAAEDDLKEKRKEVDKLDQHKAQWLKEKKIELMKEESKQQDEVGETTYLANKSKQQ